HQLPEHEAIAHGATPVRTEQTAGLRVPHRVVAGYPCAHGTDEPRVVRGPAWAGLPLCARNRHLAALPKGRAVGATPVRTEQTRGLCGQMRPQEGYPCAHGTDLGDRR